MPTRLVHLVVDAADPGRLARFWAGALGWEVASEEPDEVDVCPPGFSYPDPSALPLVFVPVPEPKNGKNRVHLDLATESATHQAAEVERLLALGAVPADIGQGEVPWTVLADRADPSAVAGFWALATGWAPTTSTAGGLSLRSPDGLGPYLELLPSADPKAVKNRIHLDVAPYQDEDHAAAILALTEAGAVRLDIGQGDTPWTVLADPEGSEFCVLSPR